jgi:hypothetical protein
MRYTKEQSKYINYSKPTHTKLLACAGSGKTRCIVARMDKLIGSNRYQANQILMLTFSRFTRDDFLHKITNTRIPAQSVQTIDSFAKSIISVESANGSTKQSADQSADQSVDVCLLSYRLAKYLEHSDPHAISAHPILGQIRIIFVDEAQDLNQIQYDIFCALRDKLNILINMVGDPNQNIYQFRDSSDKYLTSFDAKVFVLGSNFRSHESIVEFSKYLRPYQSHPVICTRGSNQCKPLMVFYENEHILETNIIQILVSAQTSGIDLSEFAILSPTRGKMRSHGKSHGLCFVSNILHKARIQFKQFYEESANGDAQSNPIAYAPSKGHVNVLTYMGSKGLEWNYVIIIDANNCLINKRHYTDQTHQADQYLLYVACSRAIHNMYIFSQCGFTSHGIYFNTNRWFASIPWPLYCIDDRFAKEFAFSAVKYTNPINTLESNLGKLIDQLDCYQLDAISGLIGYGERRVVGKKRFYTRAYHTDTNCPVVLLKYLDQLFVMLCDQRDGHARARFDEIEHVIDAKHIVEGLGDDAIQWYRANRTMTWEQFDQSDIHASIKKQIVARFDRSVQFAGHWLATNNYYHSCVLGRKVWIKNMYRKYLVSDDLKVAGNALFYLVVTLHSIETQHYYHIKTKGARYTYILDEWKDMFDELEQYVNGTEHRFVQSNLWVRWSWDGMDNFTDNVVDNVVDSMGGLVPVDSVPLETMPIDSVPVDSVPLETMSVDSVPVDSVPVDSVPIDSVPIETMPIETMPIDSVPIETMPIETMPIDSVPLETMPIETMPIETLLVNIVPVDARPITCRLDRIDSNGSVWFVRCAMDITLRHTIYAILGTAIHRDMGTCGDMGTHGNMGTHENMGAHGNIETYEDMGIDMENQTDVIGLNYLNLLKGDESVYRYNVDRQTINKIWQIMLS